MKKFIEVKDLKKYLWEEIPLKQSYSRTAPALFRQASNQKSPRQKKKAIKATRRIRTIGRAMVRELLRKMNDKQLKPHVDTLLNASSILFQQKNYNDKIYSLHEPHVECISKGKAHKLYVFGTKVSIARTWDSGIILCTLTLRETHTMHTARAVLKQLKRTTGTQPEVLISDRGSWGGKDFGKT